MTFGVPPTVADELCAGLPTLTRCGRLHRRLPTSASAGHRSRRQRATWRRTRDRAPRRRAAGRDRAVFRLTVCAQAFRRPIPRLWSPSGGDAQVTEQAETSPINARARKARWIRRICRSGSTKLGESRRAYIDHRTGHREHYAEQRRIHRRRPPPALPWSDRDWAEDTTVHVSASTRGCRQGAAARGRSHAGARGGADGRKVRAFIITRWDARKLRPEFADDGKHLEPDAWSTTRPSRMKAHPTCAQGCADKGDNGLARDLAPSDAATRSGWAKC